MPISPVITVRLDEHERNVLQAWCDARQEPNRRELTAADAVRDAIAALERAEQKRAGDRARRTHRAEASSRRHGMIGNA